MNFIQRTYIEHGFREKWKDSSSSGSGGGGNNDDDDGDSNINTQCTLHQ